MASVDARVAAWVDVVAELLRRPLVVFPAEVVGAYLLREFDAAFVALNERDRDGTPSISSGVAREAAPFAGLSVSDGLQVAQRVVYQSGLLEHHALIRWFTMTGETAANTMGRVPPSVGRTDRTSELDEIYRHFDVPHQMSLPVSPDPVAYKALVVCRAGRDDFSDEDLAVALRVQGVLAALDAQCEVLVDYVPPPPLPPDGLLTARELAVLRLIAGGATAGAVGHRLGCSPRTVEKHTQSIYRKLEVRDRVSAVTVAAALGLLVRRAARADDG